MAAKKTNTVHPNKMTGKQIFGFIGDLKAEFKKISWTSKDELKVYTKIVVASIFAFGMAIYITDLLIQTALSGIDIIFRWIAG
ncbi:MAG: preprotein translocase subunit SecE [Chlamydiota bacterium]